MTRLAVIDVGSNSVRFIVTSVDEDGHHRTIDDERAQTRLGEGLATTGALSHEAMDRTAEALSRMLRIAANHQVDRVRAVATAAVRRASNGEGFVERMHRELGLDIEVLSAHEEGRLVFLGVAHNFELDGRVAALDIGGGSIEFVRGAGREIESIASLPEGVVTLKERLAEDPPSRRELKTLRKHVRTMLSDAVPDTSPVSALVGSGGTVTSLGAMSCAVRGIKYENLQGLEVPLSDVVHFTSLLRDRSLEARMKVPGLPKYRADIILPGLVVVREAMELLGSNHIVVNTKGIREGIILDTLAPSRQKVSARDRRRAALQFAERLQFESKHSRHVANTAVSIWEQTDPSTRVLTNERQLLEIAGILHDVGYFIAYERHHMHSEHLIRHADLPGLTPRELRLVAAIARYHRGALPKRKHESYGDLTEEDREVVRRLAGILRLADGLDRGRMQRVKSVVLDWDDGSCLLKLQGTDLSVEAHGGLDKGLLFEKAYHTRLSIESGGRIDSRERDPAA